MRVKRVHLLVLGVACLILALSLAWFMPLDPWWIWVLACLPTTVLGTVLVMSVLLPMEK